MMSMGLSFCMCGYVILRIFLLMEVRFLCVWIRYLVKKIVR